MADLQSPTVYRAVEDPDGTLEDQKKKKLTLKKHALYWAQLAKYQFNQIIITFNFRASKFNVFGK